jgi:peptidoglycan/xylan/chitin deacetylase (PgdA/CDA1 family)
VYLTFDDGPTRNITPKVLEILDCYSAKATFFCLGKNVVESPELLIEIKSAGHAIGNHGYNHLSGWVTPNDAYIENAIKGMQLINSNLFRPPYGKITPIQIKKLKSNVKIVIWSIMSMDFDNNLSAVKCLNNLINHIYPGAIIVFHDTEQAEDRLFYILPKLLDYLARNNYKTQIIN